MCVVVVIGDTATAQQHTTPLVHKHTTKHTQKCGAHLEALGGNVANAALDIVGDPLDKVARVFVLYVQHLLIHLLARHAPTEQGRGSQVATVTRISSAHHVLGVPHLLGELGHRECTVLLAPAAGEGCKAHHEKVQTRKGDEVDRQLAQVGVELPWEAQAAGDARHDCADQVVEVTKGGGGELERAEANVIQRLVIQDHALVGVFHKLVHRQCGIVGLHHSVRHLGGWHDAKGAHHAVGVFFTDLGDKEGTHATASTTTK